MDYLERQEQVAFFDKPTADGDAAYMICTDAAAEGINLQRACWLMVNYDILWNPARLEQRMGRIHRYKADPRGAHNQPGGGPHARRPRAQSEMFRQSQG